MEFITPLLKHLTVFQLDKIRTQTRSWKVPQIATRLPTMRTVVLLLGMSRDEHPGSSQMGPNRCSPGSRVIPLSRHHSPAANTTEMR